MVKVDTHYAQVACESNPGRRRPARLGEDVVLDGDRTDARLDPKALVGRWVRPEEELAAVEELDAELQAPR
jgi:hypothetical protein